MNTKRLKKRDRDWAKGMVLVYQNGFLGRGHSTEKDTRNARARSAHAFLREQDPFQQEALVIKP